MPPMASLQAGELRPADTDGSPARAARPAPPAEPAPAFETVPCPGCGGDRWAVTYQGRDWTLGYDTVLQVVRCEGCGLHYTNPRPRLDQLGRYYPDDYHCYQGVAGSGESDVSGASLRALVLRDAYGTPAVRPRGWRRAMARAAQVVRRADRFGAGVPFRGQGRLLDFGCGEGKFLRRMAGLGWDVTGLDFGAAAVAGVRASGLKALLGSLPHPELPPASFDVVTMRQALEHVPDPRGVLRAAREVLAPGGLLVVEVPNYASWEAEHFGDASMLIDLPRHLLHFTPPTLASLLEGCGFRVTRVMQVGRANWTRKAAAKAARRPPRRGDTLLRSSAVCRAVAWWTQLRGRGNEIVAWAEK
jgi:SAM-dependent methyltransferase